MRIQTKRTNDQLLSGPNPEKLSTNLLSHHHRVQRWANFIAGYSVEFVEQCLLQRDCNEDLVLDPFLGCGTTLVTAKNMGFQGVGYDRHPVFHNLAKAKLGSFSLRDLEKVRAELLNSETATEWTADSEKFLLKLFSEEDLTDISRASGAVNRLGTRLKPLGIAFFLRACEASCGAQTDGIYKAPTSLKNKIPFAQAVEKAYLIFSEDISSDWYREHWVGTPNNRCFNKSSTKMTEVDPDSVGICVTSPPYLNNFDYAEMTRMHLYLLGWAGSWKEISSSIRDHLITNTTTALKGKKTSDVQLQRRSELPAILNQDLDEIVESLEAERGNRAGKKEYCYIVYNYYSEIRSVLEQILQKLKSGGELHWVVADSALYGIHVKTHLHTVILLEQLGFVQVSIKFLRRRGHRWILKKRDGAKEGLGEFHITAYKA